MSELDKLLRQDPEFLSINDWKKNNNNTGDEIKNRRNYANYVRGEYVSAGLYDDRVANEIKQSTLESAFLDGVIKPDDEDAEIQLFAPEELDLDSKLQMVLTNLDTEEPAWQAASKYLAFKKANPEGVEVPEDIRLKGEDYFADAVMMADTGYRKAAKNAVRSGELPLAKVKNDEGEYEILVSPNLGSMNMAEAIRASKKGDISFADATAVQSKLSTPIGFNEPMYKIERYSQAASAIETYSKQDTHTAKIIQNYSDELAAADKDGRAPKSFDDYSSVLRYELNKSGLLPEDEAVTDEEISKAMTQIAYNNANAGGKFKLYDNPEEAYKNVRNVGFQSAFVHPSAMVNDTLFKQSVVDNPNLSEDQKKIIEARREPLIEQSFDQSNEILSKSSKSDEWLNALQAGRVNGKKNGEILKEFVSDPDNFNEIGDRLVGIGGSIIDGVGEMAAAIPMMMGADWARDYMVGNIKERSNRKEVARLFGAEYGVGQELMESIAPMLADMGATTLLAGLTAPAAGTGGALYLSSKQGARLTAKGMLKSMTSNALRQLPTETAEEAAERLVAQNLITASTKEAGVSGAQAAIKGFNSQLVKQVGIAPAIALPAFNRSAGSTYASVYTTLENNKDLTPEEKHDRALGAALTSGTITAAITAGFSGFGRSGLEGALLGGASRKQVKNIMARLGNVDDIPDEVFNEVVSKRVSETMKKYAFETSKEIGRNALDEGAEEGLDQFINGFVTDAATDENTPFLEKLEQAGRAALIGGVIGGGVPAIKAAKNAVSQRSDIGAQMAVEIDFAKGVSQKLTEAGSPLTAQTVYGILTAPRRTRAPIAQTILEASRQPAVETVTEIAEETPEVKDAGTPDIALTPERLTETLNNSTSPETVAKAIVDERGQSQFGFVEDIPLNEVAKRGRTVRKQTGPTDPVTQQMEFDFNSQRDNQPQDQLDLGLDTTAADKPKVKVKRTATVNKSVKKAGLAEQLGLDFDQAATEEQNNHIDANYSDEDLTDQERSDIEAELQGEIGQLPDNERIRATLELFGALESEQQAAVKPKGKKAAKNIPAQATAAPVKPPILGTGVGAREPMFAPDEFIDDELIGQEVSALSRIATLGYPVRLERKALHGLPQRGKYPTGYLVGKSDMAARKISELYPVRIDQNAVEAETIVSKEKVSFYDPKVKAVVRRTPKASIDKNGVGIFNNDPVSMKLLLDRHIPVVVPDSFVPSLNPSFRTYSYGNTRYLSDIVMTNPETGTGFVSVLTKEDKVISSEPNYKYYQNLSTFTALFNPEVMDRTVPDPKGGSGEVTLDSIIYDADQLYITASTDRPTSAYGDPVKAQATLRSILKPRKGTLELEFFEAALSGLNMSVRKEAYLHELRLGMDKFAERKSGEATPTLKTDKIKEAITDFVSRTKVDNKTAAVNIAKVFGSDINPEEQPDLVLQKFIEDTVLVRPPYMPSLREIGAKVGNAFAEQQRSRDIFARKALFQTTDPTDLAQLRDQIELFDPEAEAADDTFIIPREAYEAPDPSMIAKVLKEVAFDAADALDTDPEMRADVDRLLRRTVFKGNSAIDITKLSSNDVFGMLASWMASGNYNTNPDAIKFQRRLRDGEYVSGDRLRRMMKMMYLSSKTIEGNPTKDDAYVDSIRENLANSFGRSVSKQEASDFIKAIGGAAKPLWSRSYVRGEQIIFARQQNDAAVERLGLKTNDPESVINAFKVIASTEADPNKRLLAKLLLENQGYIRQVEFSIDESPLEYSGGYIVGSNGVPMISVNLDGHNGRGLADVLLHEYTHAFVGISVASPNENLNAAQRGSLQRLNGILELARRSAADSNITDPILLDGLENINEFVAHFFTSTDFQGYLKSLLPPTKQRGFFARTIDAVLDMFGLNRSKQANYQQAFTDLVDLTRAAVLRAPLTPKGLINRLANPASRTLQQVSEAAQAIRQTLGTSVEQPTQYEVYDRQTGEVVWTGTRRDIARQVQDNRDNAYGGYRFAVRQTGAATPTPETLASAIDQETEDLVSGIGAQDVVSATTETPAELTAKIKDLIRMVRRMVPAEFALEINTDMPYAAAFQGGKILLNPYAMSGTVAGLDPTSARGIVEAIMTEEAAHAASYNALTQQELDNYIATLKDSDFDAIIDSYYQSDEKRAEAKARIRSEDPAEAAREREGMAEEKLRMHSQKVTRGFTTEDDYTFWRAKPSLFQILGRYMKGFINRYMAGKSLATMNGAQRVALQRMVTEVRAINAGYRLTPNTLEFDAQNPHASLSQIATQLGAELTEAQELMPMSAVRVLHNDSAELPKPTSKITNAKVAIALADAAQKYWGRMITSTDITEEEKAEIIRNGTQEFIAALNASGKNAADWYSTAIDIAMEVAALIHPELSNIEAANKVPAFAAADNPVQAAQFAMRMALAITSQNINVKQNTKYAEEQFNILKQTGKFDSSKIYGTKALAIQSNLELANILVDSYGYGDAEAFVRKEFTVKELEEKASEIRGKKVTISGRQQDSVNGAAIFGPKIGQGFLQNLMSNFDPVTIDLWMRRTWGRWTGNVVGDGVTDERLANLLIGARDAKIKLPPFARQIKTVTRYNVLSTGKQGAPYQSVSSSVINRLETDLDYRNQFNQLAKDLFAEWQKQYKLLKDGSIKSTQNGESVSITYGKVTKELMADYRSGKIKLEDIIEDIKKFEDNLDKQFELEKAKAKKSGEKFKTKIADWRYDGYINADRTESFSNKDISELKPAWARAADVIKAELNPIDIPSDQDRRVITEIVNGIRAELESLGYVTTNADIQAVLWYPEKDLWSKLAGKEESNLKQSYDDEFINIATERGLGGEARQLAESVRADRATRNSQRDDARPNEEVFAGTHAAFKEARASQIGTQLTPTGYERLTPSIYELSLSTDPDAGRRFVEGISRTASEHPMGAAVEVKPAEYYNDSNNRLFLTEDGLAGVSVTSYGDLVSVFKHPTSKAKIKDILAEAAPYAVTLDAFDINGFLPDLYANYGFRPVARVPFSRDYAPQGWPFDLAGEPDVVLMVKDLDGDSGLLEIGVDGYEAIRDSIPVTDDYDAAMAMQAAAKEKVAEARASRASTLATQFGAASQLPAGFDADAIDYSNFLESLEMPLMEVGTYQSPSKLIDKLLKGELDPRILRLKNQRDFFNKATFDLVKRYKTKLDAIIKRDFGGIESAPIDLIQAATGSTKGIVVPEDVITQIEDDFTYDLEVIDMDDSLTADDKMVARDIAMANRNKTLADAEKAAADSIRTSRDQALADLAVTSPELVQHIVQLRTLTDELSKKVTELYGFPPELKAKFDNQLGIYLTRSYKMFDEVGYGEKVLNDPDYDRIREAAINFFEKQFVDSEVSRRISGPNSVPRAQAEAEAKRELGLKTMGGRSYGQLMMEEFVKSYDKSGGAISSASLSQSLKPLLDNIQMKRDIPEPIRNLLGEQGAEGGADNLLRSLVTVATMASNQSFLNHVRDVGRASGWLLTASELSEARKKDYDTYKDYKSVRESTTSSYDPIGELYGPPEMVEGFRKVFSPDGVRFNQTAAQDAVAKTIGVAAKMSGGAMAAKTLGSIGFYVRNIVSNALFFAPAQGFVNLKSMSQSAYKEIWGNALRDPDAIDAYRTKLISLGVIGDDINTNIMASMLRGGTSDDIETQLDKLLDTASKGLKPLKWLSDRAQVLSGSVDAFYKIAYYENELRVLKEARVVDTGSMASMSDQQLERMAAEKVLATAQSSSQAPPIVREFTQSGLGLLFAPFVRFKVEVPRIILNTYKTAWAEMNSSNPVLKSRGIKRFSGMSLMLGGISMVAPAIISMVRGIGDDEDEALRSSVPDYLRNHTFFYRRKDNGQLQSWDLTFLNPFSIAADPAMRSLELIFKGRPADAAAKFIETAIFDQYLDDQILSSAVQSLRDNENPTTGKPIYEPKLDNVGISLLKSATFLFKEAYQPSVVKRAIESYQAVGADYTEFDDSPIGILMREFYPVKPHNIELDKQLRRYLSETRDVYNRVNERKNVMFSKKPMSSDEVKDIMQSEIEDKAKVNEDVYKKLRGFEGLGLTPQQLYQITTGAGYGKDRTRLLFNKVMDRPVLTPEFIKKMSDPKNEQGLERLKSAIEVLQGTPRYILLEP
jgi:hypothetical protein